MLECRALSVSYGPHRALEEVSLQVAPGEIVVILGANGAGKSTLLNAIAGLVPATDGSQLLMNGQPIGGLPPHRIVEAGLALVPEGRGLFGDLTVGENLQLGAYATRARDSEAENLQRVLNLFPILSERRGQAVHTMSGGEQQMVAIGRAIMSAPSILMLDEPSLGLSPLLCGQLFKTFGEIRETGVGILLVEQNAHLGLAIADRGYVLETGRIVAEDAAHRLAQDPAVKEAYLGGGGAVRDPAAPPGGGGDMAAPPERGVPAGAPTQIPQGAPSAPGRETGANGYLVETIDQMVNRAAAIQVEQVENLRSAQRKTRTGAQTEVPPETVLDALKPPLAQPPDQAPNAPPPNSQSPNGGLLQGPALADMVNRAAAIQAGHIERMRPAPPAPAPLAPPAKPAEPAKPPTQHFAQPPPPGESDLDAALAKIEAAANNARRGGSSSTQAAARTPAPKGDPRGTGGAKGLD